VSKIELRIGEPALKRSIYADLVNLPDPVKLGLNVRIFNYDDVGLYMRIDAYNAAWTFGTVDYGLLASGANDYKMLDQFGSRAKPAAATSETITVRLRAYTDAGYTILKWTFERLVDVVFIKSDDGSWTQDVLNNFDDGTVQGWAASNVLGNTGGYPTLIVDTAYVLSTPYSLRMMSMMGASFPSECISYMGKSFTTPNKNNVYAIIDVRHAKSGANAFVRNIEVRTDGTIIVVIGLPWTGFWKGVNYVPQDRWMRMVVPLPKNTALELRIYHYIEQAGAGNQWGRMWMDDFRIISKD